MFGAPPYKQLRRRVSAMRAAPNRTLSVFADEPRLWIVRGRDRSGQFDRTGQGTTVYYHAHLYSSNP